MSEAVRELLKRAERIAPRPVATDDDPRPEPPLDEAQVVPQWVRVLRSWTPPQASPPIKPVEWDWHQWMQRRKVGVLVAAGGTGKTTFELNKFVHGAVGRPFLGHEVARGSYVLLSSDDSQEDLDGALVRSMKDLQLSEQECEEVRRRVRVHSLQGLGGERTFARIASGGVVSTGLEHWIVDALRDVPDLRILALDTLRQFSGGSPNEDQVVGATIAGANVIAQALGCSVLITHHTGKQNFREEIQDQYCGSGSAAIADNARFVFLLQNTTWADIESKVRRTGQENGSPMVLRSTRGSLLVRPPAPLFLYRETDSYCIKQVAGAEMSGREIADEKDRQILAAVRGGDQSKTSVARTVGGRKEAVLKRVDSLLERGLLLDTGSRTGSGSKPLLMVSTQGARFLDEGR